MKNRIDTLRGCACVLLVVYHVIGSDPTSGLRIADGALRTSNDMLALVRMPLFAMIAGWVYALKPLGAGAPGGFLWRKSKRLLVPMVCVGTVFIAAQSFMPGVNNVYSGIPFVSPVAHLWFVQAIFLIFVLVAGLDRMGAIGRPGHLALAFAAASLAYLFGPQVHVFAIGGAIYLLPFFLLGLALGRFPLGFAPLDRPLVQVALFTLAACVLLTWELTGDRHTALYLIVGIALCAIAAGSGAESRCLTFLAKYSFSIYLFHVFFTAGSRIVLERVGIDTLATHVAAGILAGLAGPLVLQAWLERRPVAMLLLLGKPPTDGAPVRAKPAATLARRRRSGAASATTFPRLH